MPVHPRAAFFLAVVQMHSPKVFESNLLLKFIHRELVAHFVADVVAGGESVASVYADTHAALVVDAADNAGYLAELVPQVGALAGGVLNHGGDTFGFLQCEVDFLGNLVQAGFLAHEF